MNEDYEDHLEKFREAWKVLQIDLAEIAETICAINERHDIEELKTVEKKLEQLFKMIGNPYIKWD